MGNPDQPRKNHEGDVQRHDLAVAKSLFIEPCKFPCLSHPLESPDSAVSESLDESDEDLRQTFQNSNSTDPTAPECAAVCMHEPSPEPARLVFDWYFHLHHLQWSLSLPQDASLQQTMDVMDRIHEDYQVDLPGCIALFFDIPFYPSPERLVALSSDSVSVAFGVHPKQPPLQRKR